MGDVLLADPTWEEGKPLPDGWTLVEYATQIPEAGVDEVVYEVEPTIKNGKYVQKFATRPMTAEEIERRDAPKTAKEKLVALGLTEVEIQALSRGLVGG